MERNLIELKKKNEILRLSNEKMKNPRQIECALKEKQLGLGYPHDKNVVRLRYPREKEDQSKGISGANGGTDTLLSYGYGGRGAG
jgi:hypothetical protein